MLQEIIVGERISIHEKVVTAASEDSSTLLYLESEELLEKIWVDTSRYTIDKILLKDKLFKQDMSVTFDGYNYSSSKPVSYKRNITMNRDTKTARLSMEVMRINFNEELSFPFEINEKYKRVE
jgi:hypothetical protein